MIPLGLGRRAFGEHPGSYDAARPAYPEWVFHLLRETCGLRPSVSTFEIGPGTGIATRRLLELGADPLIAVEPDHQLATFLLSRNSPNQALKVVTSTFEAADLQNKSFDLGVSATSFHWMREEPALNKVAKLLRPRGWWAMFWNVFGDARRSDPFKEATKHLFKEVSSPTAGHSELAFALDTQVRIDALRRVGAFDHIEHRAIEWPLILNSDQTRALYATFSDISIRPDREQLLNEVQRIACNKFHGRVTRNIVTSVYVARRRG